MVAAPVSVEEMTLNVVQEIRVKASLEATFAAVLEELGPGNIGPDGTPMRFKLEDWPGGRWFRDLGEGNGHWWGNVQAIKRPTLLELSGPLFMSYAGCKQSAIPVEYGWRRDCDSVSAFGIRADRGCAPQGRDDWMETYPRADQAEG